MTDQHQPAAAAPRLSEAEIDPSREDYRIRGEEIIRLNRAALRLVDKLNAARADLARARAEAAALKAERDDAVAALDDQLAALQAAIDRAKNFPCPACGQHLSVACTCETPQPAAPVARSAEAEQSKVPTGFIEVRPGLYERQRPAPNWDQPQPAAPVDPRGVACPQCGGDAFASFDVIVGRGCGHVVDAITPPDHQAGDEP